MEPIPPALPHRIRRAVLASALTLLASSVWAQAAITERTLQFAKGQSAGTAKGSLRGDQTVDYVLRAKAGQQMKVRLQPATLYFNVLPPGSNDLAIFVGSRDGDTFAGALPADGEYRIRLYQMGAAKGSSKVRNYTLDVSIGAAAPAAGAAADHVERASQGRFDATGTMPCAWATGQPMSRCDFGVARAGGGTATVVVTRPDGRKRTIFFEKGQATGADLSQADGDLQFGVSKEADLFKIQAGRERYEFPEAVIFGG
jgi:hypothetical protein